MILSERGRTSPELLLGAFAIMFSMGTFGLLPRFQCKPGRDEKCQLTRAISTTAKLVHTMPVFFQLMQQEPGKFIFRNAITLAMVANFAYAPNALAELTRRFWGITNVCPFVGKGTGVEGIVFATDDYICVAFKGTGNLYDLMTDLRFDRFPLRGKFVHYGIYTALNEVALEVILCINKMLDENPERKIFVTGHSLGAGLAILFAARYTLCEHTARPEALHGIYTFAGPRIGDKAFAVAYNNVLKDKTFRIVNHGDFVPTLPPFGYKHVGIKIYIDRHGNFHKKTCRDLIETVRESIYTVEAASFGINLEPHKMITYIYRLMEAVKSSL